jgi:hypothetical protein
MPHVAISRPCCTASFGMYAYTSTISSALAGKKTYFDYQDKLMKVRAWPLEHVFHYSSTNDIISRLSKFLYTPTTTTCTAPFPGCH